MSLPFYRSARFRENISNVLNDNKYNPVRFLDTFTENASIALRSRFNRRFSRFVLYRELGNSQPIPIELGNEKQMINNWMRGLPLKVITHGWLGSDEDDKGVFAIKTGNFLKKGEGRVF